MNKQSFFSRRAFMILMGVVFLMPIALRGARFAAQNSKNDVKNWLPAGFEETRELEWFKDHFLGQKFVVVSWEGCKLDDPRLELLARKLAPPPGIEPIGGQRMFSSVTTGRRVLERMTDPAGSLKLSRKEAIRRLQGSLIGSDGETTCLLATLTEEAGEDLRSVLGNARPLNKILMGREDGWLYRIAEQECAIPKAKLLLGGPPVDNVTIDDEGEITLLRLVGLCGLLGLVLAWFCFRSARITMMVFCCGTYGAAGSLAIVYFTRGRVDAILMTMPSLVYVLALSGAIHLINYYKDAVREHGVEGAAGRALRYGWLPCTLASITTALGLISLYASEVIPIRKFGSYSAIGVLFSLAIIFAMLPALLELFPPKQKKKEAAAEALGPGYFKKRLMGAGDWIINRHGLVTCGCSVLLLFFAVGLTRVETTVQLLKLFDSEADIISDYTWLEQNLGNLVPMEVVLRVDQSRMRGTSDPVLSDEGRYRLTFLERMELVQRVQQRIESLPDVGRALAMTTFAPTLPEQTGGLVTFAERSGFNSGLEAHRNEYEEADYYRVADDGEELLRISARVAALSDVDYGHFVDDIRREVQPILAAYHQRDELLGKIVQPGESLRGKRVCVIGVPRKPKVDDDDPAIEQSAATTVVDTNLTPNQIAADTLVDLLRVAGIKVTPIYEAPEGFTPKRQITGDTENPKAAKFLGQFDAIYLAADHPSMHVDFIGRYAKELIDARGFESQAVDRDAEAATGLWVVYTGVVPLVYKAQRTLLIGLVESIFVAFVLICIVMIMILRSPMAGLLSMLPNLFPVVMIFGLMGWLGILIDIGTMMTASVAMGVAVDDTVHFLTWFRRGIMAGLDRKAAVRLAYERCATAMMQTTIIGGLGLGIFALSTFTPTQRFGFLMMTLLAAALVGDLIFLPALLAGPVGQFFSKKKSTRATMPDESRTESAHSDTVVPPPHILPQPQPTDGLPSPSQSTHHRL